VETDSRDRLLGLADNPAASSPVLLRLLAIEARECWDAAFRSRPLPPDVVEMLLAHPDRDIRSRVAANPHVDADQRERLLTDEDFFVRLGLARSATVRWGHSLSDGAVRALFDTGPEVAWEALVIGDVRRRVIPIAAAHPSPAVRAHLCRVHLCHLPRVVWQALEADPEPAVRAELARTLAEDQRLITRAVLGNHRWARYADLLMFLPLPRKAIDAVLERDDPDDVRRLARNRHLPPDVVAILTRHPSRSVRAQVCVRFDLTAEQLTALTVDPDVRVRTAASTNSALTEKQRMAVDIEVPVDGDFVPRWEVFSGFDLEVTLKWARSAHPILRRWAATDARLPADMVERLAADDDLGVRVQLAQHHPDAPPWLILRCFLEYTGYRRWDLVTRPGFPTAGLARYAADPDPKLRRAAALDPQLAPHLADALSRDPDQDVRALGARSPQLPPERLRELLFDPQLARSAAANSALTQLRMHELLDQLEIPT
jgi:hypothetical protein